MQKKANVPISVDVIMQNKNEVSAEYVNSFMVHSNPVEFVVEFGYVDLPEVMRKSKAKAPLKSVDAVVKSKLVILPQQIPQLIKALQEQYDKIGGMKEAGDK